MADTTLFGGDPAAAIILWHNEPVAGKATGLSWTDRCSRIFYDYILLSLPDHDIIDALDFLPGALDNPHNVEGHRNEIELFRYRLSIRIDPMKELQRGPRERLK